MTEPVRPNTEVTGTDTVAGVSHTAVPPDIESISPFEPRVSPIVFPTRESQLLNVRILSLRATTPERVERLELVVARFVFVVERLPESVVILDSVVEILPERVVMFVVFVAMLDSVVATRPERVDTVELVVARFVVRVAMLPVAVARLEFVVLRFVVRVVILPVAVLRFVLMVAREPVMVAMFEFIPATVPLIAFCARREVK
jgi:hypothetical protein